ncbi:MAG: SIMPL domain-containing protein [Vulcanimicrobiaceae bacterium]
MKSIAAILALAFAALPLAGAAQSYPDRPQAATLSVTGEGQAARAPDQASIRANIVTNDNDASTSTSKNNDIYNALVKKVATLGIASSAIHTESFNVQFIPNPPKNLPPEQRQPRYGYVTTRSIAIDVNAMDRVGAAIDAATAAGVTDVGNVSFGLRDRRAAYREALAVAMRDAQAQAQTLAAAGGFRLVRIQHVNAGFTPSPRPLYAAAPRMALAESTPTEIQPTGPIEVDAHVSVTYTIE